MSHTPTPWHLVEPRSRHGHLCEIYSDGNHIAHVYGRNPNEREANGVLIVKCVNSHEQLVEALEAITNVSAGGPHVSAEEGVKANWSALMRCRDIARTTLAALQSSETK